MKYSGKDVEITSDFECGNGEDIKYIGFNHFSMRARKDWGSGDFYNTMSWYFCIRIKNKLGVNRLLRLDVHGIDKLDGDEAYVWMKKRDKWSRVPNEVSSASCGEWNLTLSIDLKPYQTVYVSNSFWYPPSKMTKWLNRISNEKADLCKLSSIGKTAQGRPINVLTIFNRSNVYIGRIVVAASPQPSEFGAWACHGLIEYLLSDDSFARYVRRKWIIDVIPQTNPDGEALGTVMVNSLGENPLFEFDRIASGDTGSVEATSLWNWIAEHRPNIYIEYHSYYQPNRPSFRPYLFAPELHDSEIRRKIQKSVNKNLMSISSGPPMIVDVGDKRFSRSLPYQLIQKFGVISYFYKLHTRESLESNLKQAVKVFKTIVHTYENVSRAI
ncbi:hypothetical protein DRO55_04260 [Candidatus Bathyarchaeota archaeon]|nr:MAG: hypothetical protein DRO55_04260 [Candidatus Bathyarchaeota archaeon]